MTVATSRVERLFAIAEREGRSFLLEPEVYAVLKAAGLAVPRFLFVARGERVTAEALAGLGSSEVVLKIVSPLLIHKSDVGGVAFAPARPAAVNKAMGDMLESVPGRAARWLKGRTKGTADASASAGRVRGSLRGVLICEKVRFADVGFGSELLLGARNTPEFGPVVTMGGGGLDVEYMNERLREGRAAALGSAHLLPAGAIRALLEPLAFTGKVAADFRGRGPLVTPAGLISIFDRFRGLVRAFSPFDERTPYVIEELEINPLVVRAGTLIPLDGVCRFSRAKTRLTRRPPDGIGRLLRPASIAVIGVSEKMNIGRIILQNVLKNGFPRERTYVVKPGCGEIDGCRCVASVRDLPETVDLFVLTLAAEQCPAVMRELAASEKARSVIIIAGGMGEKQGTKTIEDEIRGLLDDGRAAGRATPVVNGGNCVGVISKPGRYDTTFIPERKLPRPRSRRSPLVFLSQSGAFLCSQMSKLAQVEPLYDISLGNQLDLTVSDYLDFLKDEPEARVFAVYMEGFKPADGHLFARTVAEVTGRGKTVLVYKSGRSPEGRAATSSHTASVAGDYAVCRSVLEQAGAIVAADLFEFESFLKGLVFLDGRRARGNRAGLISNAGFECVIMADSLADGHRLELARFADATREKIAAVLRPLGIDKIQDIRNPLDVTPVADDAAFSACAKAILEDPGVDAAVVSSVPMTPAMQTLPASAGDRENMLDPTGLVPRLVEVFRATDKPVVVNIDAGVLYTPLAEALENAGIPVFRRSDEAVRFLRKYVNVTRRR